jgi:hypothetical protein
MIMNLIAKPGSPFNPAPGQGFRRKTSLCLLFCLSLMFAFGQQGGSGTEIKSLKRFSGKYETNGMVIQVVLKNNKLVMYVPGAPVQELIAAGSGRFTTTTFSDEIFRFEEKEGKVDKMVSERGGDFRHTG